MQINSKLKKFFKNIFYFLKDNNLSVLGSKSLFYNLLLSFLCVFAFFLPDYVLKINGSSHVKNQYVFALAFFVFGFVISMLRSKKVFLIFISTFFVFEMIQLHYMAYFGQPITPMEIKKIFTETADIAQSGFDYFFAVWYVLPSMIISYGIYIYFYLKYFDKCFKTKIAYLLLIIVLLIKPQRACRKTLKSFLPGPTRNSIHNTLNTFSYFFVKEIWSKNMQKNISFKKYKIEKIKNYEKPDIIIFWVVESMNYKHLSLYGYERDTTPNLNQIKNKKNFIFKKAYSSSVSTSSSLPFLFNAVREPGNFKALNEKDTNLIKLAKNNDYKTYFFTSQESKNLNDVGINFLDENVSKDDNPILFLKNKDDELFKYLNKALKEEYDYKFISVLQRNLHSPYELNYKNHKEFAIYDINQKNRKGRMVNAYDNAVLYEDYILNKLIKIIDNIKDKKIILIITADHGQMLGEDNMYGHNMLDERVAQVPLILYYNSRYSNFFENINLPDHISHYEIGKIVANFLGYSIINPNENGEFFIQGNNIYFDNFIIPYNRIDGGVNFKKIDSSYNYFSNLKIN